MTTTEGLRDSITSIRASSLVSQNIFMSARLSPRRCARNFTCPGLSSPETYRTCPDEAQEERSCSISVDLPIPGSPPTRTELGLMIPPPRTLSSSLIPHSKRLDESTTTSASFFSLLSSGDITDCTEEEGTALTTFSSSKLFQAPQLGHRPSHLVSTLPQAEHTKRI